MPTRLLLALLFNAICIIPPARAHYLWATIDGNAGEHGTTNVYFEHSPAVGDGHYLDRFVKGGKTWIRTVEHIEPQVMTIKDHREGNKRWLSGAAFASHPTCPGN